MKKYVSLLLGIVVIGAFVPFFIKATPSTKKTGETYIIKAIKTPENLTFAQEVVPLHKQDIVERLDRELLVNTYWQSNGLLLIKRAHKYFPIIEPILAKHNIPNDFKYLAVIESGLQNVTSPAGARGFWQLLATTAKEYGLEVNDNVDERYHLEKATEAACQYLLKAKEKFGTWTEAAAAYNIGIQGLSRRLIEQQVTSYYDLLLPDETSRYVPRIIAIKEILSKPYDFGFVYDKNDLYKLPQYRSVKIDTAITNIASFAKKFDTNYKEIKLLNPWLRENVLNNRSRKMYEIKLLTQEE
ncbi:lytic transglycosylase domain-containing protein [Wenyingzhuangia sp. 2_MG-2023]|uniref:lytic transglycosylase domain-containing protein n=1 Tax=Wenyingzhuangia sp. 2_MG-2023 TaxID=3062639 RepID=UPI0026E413C2|nr:lytic transglycosylase domain-containing protein [Wenyingzhuangia sp. 2_MG-2023]MDO6738568.1 lytic transglycosylase domain-containing protein [Wenyingzhuangia sp. 2_MG-2023]